MLQVFAVGAKPLLDAPLQSFVMQLNNAGPCSDAGDRSTTCVAAKWAALKNITTTIAMPMLQAAVVLEVAKVI